MRTLVLIVRVTASAVLGVAFFVALLLGVLFNMVHQDLLNEEFYVRHLAANDVYERIHSDILPAVTATPLYYGGLQVSDAEAQALRRAVFPARFIRVETEGVIRSFVPWLTGEAQTLTVVIDLTLIKADARTVAMQFAKSKLNTIPSCPDSRGPGFDSATTRSFPDCVGIFPDRDTWEKEYLIVFVAAIDQALAKAPDQLNLVAVGAQQAGLSRDDFLDRLKRLRTVVAIGNALGGVFTIGTLVALGLVMGAVHLPRPRGSAMWVGATVALSGGVILATTLVARAVLPPRVEAFILSQPDLYPKAVQLVTDVSRSAFYEMAADLARPSAIAFGVGMLLFSVSFLLPRRVSVPSAERLRLRALRRYLRRPHRSPRG